MTMSQTPEQPGLLWPPNKDYGAAQAHEARLNDSTAADLGLEHVIAALCLDRSFARDIRSIIIQLCTDPDVIHYRQAILDDLLT